MEERKNSPFQSHRLLLEDRQRGTVTGVMDVKSFDEKLILLATEYGLITLKGEKLHINQLDLEKGEVELSSRVDSVVYTEKRGYGQKKEESLLGRLFQ